MEMLLGGGLEEERGEQASVQRLLGLEGASQQEEGGSREGGSQVGGSQVGGFQVGG